MSTRQPTVGCAKPAPLRQRLDVVVAEVFGIEPTEVGDDLGYGSIPGWDSVGHVDLLYALEQAFGIEVNADAIARLTSIRSIEAELLARRSGGGAAPE